ncbi:hypothetical protein I4F81_012104 [Pyropia yezoensis]|uniref:Uncharacterized protein n=1 Tax=Pyropia yezoensis TaxID=2788 RepID=A0ACC3CHQ7_PYRYE|nr:hypothetical protein I4F81_012104 [Neopyropia yezoensis]
MDDFEMAVLLCLDASADAAARGRALAYCDQLRSSPDAWQARFWCLTVLHDALVSRTRPLADADRAAVRSCVTAQLRSAAVAASPAYVRNKLAQLYATLIAADYPATWPGAFSTDLVTLSRDAGGRDAFFRILRAVDEDVTSVRAASPAGARVKDGMREDCISGLVATWASTVAAAAVPGATAADTEAAIAALDLIRRYAQWVDIGLFLTNDLLRVIYAALTGSAPALAPLAAASAAALSALVAKRMAPAAKASLLAALQLRALLPALATELPPQGAGDAELGFRSATVEVANLVNTVATVAIGLAGEAGGGGRGGEAATAAAEAAALVETALPVALRYIANEEDEDVAAQTLEFISAYVSAELTSELGEPLTCRLSPVICAVLAAPPSVVAAAGVAPARTAAEAHQLDEVAVTFLDLAARSYREVGASPGHALLSAVLPIYFGTRGLDHPSPRVRSRAAALLLKLVRPLRSAIAARHLGDVVPALVPRIFPLAPAGSSVAADQDALLDTAGLLLGVDPSAAATAGYLTSTLAPIIDGLRAAATAARAAAAPPSTNGGGGGGVFDAAAAQRWIAAAAQLRPPFPEAVLAPWRAACEAVLALSAAAGPAVQARTLTFLHRMVETLGEVALPFIAAAMETLVSPAAATPAELNAVVVLVNQVVSRFRAAAAPVAAELYLPLCARVAAAAPALDPVRLMAVAEADRERVELHRNWLLFIHGWAPPPPAKPGGGAAAGAGAAGGGPAAATAAASGGDEAERGAGGKIEQQLAQIEAAAAAAPNAPLPGFGDYVITAVAPACVASAVRNGIFRAPAAAAGAAATSAAPTPATPNAGAGATAAPPIGAAAYAAGSRGAGVMTANVLLQVAAARRLGDPFIAAVVAPVVGGATGADAEAVRAYAAALAASEGVVPSEELVRRFVGVVVAHRQRGGR